MAEFSMLLLDVAFYSYLAATIFFVVSVTGRKWRNKEGEETGNRWAAFGYAASILGVVVSLGYFITRWIAGGYAPVSNMFEYLTFFAITISIAFVILYGIYRSRVLGLVTMPIIMLMIAYAALFTTDVQALQPSLQSNWLWIHVITTAIGQGILTISFAAGLIYLLRTIDLKQKKMNKKTVGIEVIMYALVSWLAFIIVTNVFDIMDYVAAFTYTNEYGETAEKIYTLPAILGPNEGVLQSEGRMQPWLEMPDWIISEDLNNVVWALGTGLVLYLLIRLISRRRVGALLQPLVKGVKPATADELSYRAIAIGFPVFALGGLVFAMIYAQIAWTRFWGWDPKEVWALVTFLFYAAYLHLRLSRNWQGERSAWLCVIGFAIIMFNLIFVNLVIAGLHSYA